MQRVGLIASGIFVLALLLTGGIVHLRNRRIIPPPLEVSDCSIDPPHEETPKARFIRRGGRTIRPIKMWHKGDALTVDDVAEGRDLSLYDRLELVSRPMVVIEMNRDVVRAQARSFLWDHWRDRKPAYLIMTLSSVDSTSTSHVFVERDKVGRWRLYWRTVRSREIVDSPTDYRMQWVMQNRGDEPGTPLPLGMKPDPVKHRLEFRDICGDVDGGF